MFFLLFNLKKCLSWDKLEKAIFWFSLFKNPNKQIPKVLKCKVGEYLKPKEY